MEVAKACNNSRGTTHNTTGHYQGVTMKSGMSSGISTTSIYQGYKHSWFMPEWD